MPRLIRHKLAGMVGAAALAIATAGGAPWASAAIIHGGGGGFHGGGFHGGFGGFHGGGSHGGFGGFHGGFGHGFAGVGHGFGGFGRHAAGFGHGFGGRSFGGGHFAGGHFVGNHFAGSHFGGSRFGGPNQFAGGRQFGRRVGFNRNAFGAQGGWNRFAGNGWAGGWGAGWGGWGGGWGGWGGWVGPVFWPFVLGDLFSYALWPYDYYYPFWSYGTALAYDYGPYVPAYGYSGLSNIYGYAANGGNGGLATSANTNQIPPDVTQSCGGFAPGVTGLPIDEIRQAIHPTGEQVTFLDDLAAASSKASAILNASCPSEPPLTPLARLDAVQTRLEASIQAIETVRPPLVNLYDSLSDEQSQRLDAIGAKEARYGTATAASGSSGTTALASLCGDQAADFTRLPAQRIQEIIKPTGPQESALEDLKQASAKAADELRASCPKQLPEALPARLDEMTAQLNAMVRAVKSLRPTLATFYASLSDEQKAQFNNMGESSGQG
jgi:hypothetical protein